MPASRASRSALAYACSCRGCLGAAGSLLKTWATCRRLPWRASRCGRCVRASAWAPPAPCTTPCAECGGGPHARRSPIGLDPFESKRCPMELCTSPAQEAAPRRVEVMPPAGEGEHAYGCTNAGMRLVNAGWPVPARLRVGRLAKCLRLGILGAFARVTRADFAICVHHGTSTRGAFCGNGDVDRRLVFQPTACWRNRSEIPSSCRRRAYHDDRAQQRSFDTRWA